MEDGDEFGGRFFRNSKWFFDRIKRIYRVGKLPGWWFVENAFGVGEDIRKSRGFENAPPNLFIEIYFCRKHIAEALLRIDQADECFEPLPHDFDWAEQVGIVGYNDSALHAPIERVQKQGRGEVDIRAFLLGFQDIDEHRRAAQGKQGHFFDALEKGSELNIHVRKGPQRTQIGVLAVGLIGIDGIRLDRRGKITDRRDLMTGQKNFRQCLGIHPTDAESPASAVVEVEAINVEDGLHLMEGKSEGRTLR